MLRSAHFVTSLFCISKHTVKRFFVSRLFAYFFFLCYNLWNCSKLSIQMQLCTCHQCEMDVCSHFPTIEKEILCWLVREWLWELPILLMIPRSGARGKISLIGFASSRLQTIRGESRLQTSHWALVVGGAENLVKVHQLSRAVARWRTHPLEDVGSGGGHFVGTLK